jgi:hypothetical protein
MISGWGDLSLLSELNQVSSGKSKKGGTKTQDRRDQLHFNQNLENSLARKLRHQEEGAGREYRLCLRPPASGKILEGHQEVGKAPVLLREK